MKTVIVFLVLCVLIPLPLAMAAVAPEDAGEKLADELAVEDLYKTLPPEAQPMVDGLSPGETPLLNTAFNNLLRVVSRESGGALRSGVRGMIAILAVILLCGIVSSSMEGTPGRSETVTLAGVLCIGVLALGQVGTLLQAGVETITKIDVYAKGMLATLAAVAASTGAPSGALFRHLGTLFFSDLLVTFISRVLVPFVYVYIALIIAGAASGQAVLTKIAAFVKWATAGMLGLFLSLFVLYLTLGGAVSGTTDAVLLKGTKAALSGAVPVVGRILSDAGETVLAGAGILRNSVGIFGLFAILGLVIAPFLRVGISYLLFKVAAALTAPMADARAGALLEGLSGAFAMILGMTGAASLLYFISILSTLSGAKSL